MPGIGTHSADNCLREAHRAAYQLDRLVSGGRNGRDTNTDLLETWGVEIVMQRIMPVNERYLADVDQSFKLIADTLKLRREDIAKINREFRLLIVHTNGKRPFMSRAAALFCPNRMAIYIGSDPSPIVTAQHLAHEYAHFLDYAAAQSLRSVLRDNLGHITNSVNMNLEYLSETKNETETLIKALELSIGAPKYTPRQRKNWIYNTPTSLDYANHPSEVFARMVEQATWAQNRDKFPDELSSYPVLTNTKGYWNTKIFVFVNNQAFRMIHERVGHLKITTHRGIHQPDDQRG